MKIRKIGHCCLIIETNGKKIMTDPGSFTTEGQEKENDIDLILITHEHLDHFHLHSLKKVLVNNPKAIIFTNDGVGKLLKEEGIKHEVLKDKTPRDFFGVEIEPHDCKHEEIFQDFGQVLNTGFFIDKKLFYPGDSFYNPGRRVEILALPVAGPWARIRDSINYAVAVKPKVCFPVHDGVLSQTGMELVHRISRLSLSVFNIDFKNFEDSSKTEEF